MGVTRWLLTDQHFHDLNPLIAGREACAPGHSFGPAVREYFLLHYVRRGHGAFHARGQVYAVAPGQAFLIRPGEVTLYRADDQDPWEYCWIGFNGQLASRFSQLPAVFSVPEGLLQLPEEATQGAEFWFAAQLFLLYRQLLAADVHPQGHVQKVENLIRSAYMQELRVEAIARDLNLDRRYLTRLFRQHTGLSIQQYLMQVRLEAAKRHLALGCSVQETARLCGWEDPSNFSRFYKKHTGHSPKGQSSVDETAAGE